ncbi:myosin-11-like isoform X2 [Dreissena polymorpha]|uniref:myosin-11-like isoform X2 n=1 Tax=Dreissena polymorpha TaxID=45954 RepID=UPI002263FA57|nr:myosin-11-like isoform X2 [Dreissena polymorpha]
MSANTLSPLSRGYGSWTAGYVDPYFTGKGYEENNKLDRHSPFPEVEQESHIHGVTVSTRSGRSTSMSWVPSHRSREPTNDGIPLPKTLTTRTGALQIYVAPDDLPDEDLPAEGLELQPKYVQIKRPSGKELIDLSLKLGTIERLTKSVLQFGDQEYDHEHTSITDTKNKSFLKFMRSIDNETQPAHQPDVDRTVQPGGDLNHYLRDLRSSASSRHHSDGSTYLPKSRESQELQALLRGLDNNGWPMSYPSSQDGHSTGQFTRPVSRVSSRVTSPGPPSTPRSAFQVLSAKKVAASVRAGGYLGRPGSQVSVNDLENRDSSGSPSHITSATIVRRQWTPENSTDSALLDARTSFFYGPEENGDSDENKRARELSFYSGLYPGSLAQSDKGEGCTSSEGQSEVKGDSESVDKNRGPCKEVKGVFKGARDSPGKGQGNGGQRMFQITEEPIGTVSEEKNVVEGHTTSSAGKSRSQSAAESTSDTHRRGRESESVVSATEEFISGVINVEIDEKRRLSRKSLHSRPTTGRSSTGISPSRPTTGRSSTGISPSKDSPSNAHSGNGATVISLQERNIPTKQTTSWKPFTATAYTRKSVSYDLNKLKHKNLLNRRQSAPGNVITRHYSNQLKISDNVPAVNLYSPHFAWQVEESSPDVPDTSFAHEYEYNEHHSLGAKSNDVTGASHRIVNSPEDFLEGTKANSNESGFDDSGLDNRDDFNDEVIAEEEILNDIRKCNEEIQKIEALGNAEKEEEEYVRDEPESDSESSMDEETIRVVLGVPDADISEQSAGHFEEISDKTEDVNEVMEGNGHDTDVTDVVKYATNEMEKVEEKEQPEGEVDEERLSEIKSYRSSKKGKSVKKSKSGVSDNGDIAEDDSSSGEFKLPPLASDRWLEEKDDIIEVQAALLENETTFSGDTDSYSDMLASNKQSVSGQSSRQGSAISRPQSSKSRSSALSNFQDYVEQSAAYVTVNPSSSGSRPSPAKSHVKSLVQTSDIAQDTRVSSPNSRPSSKSVLGVVISRPGSGNSRISSARSSPIMLKEEQSATGNTQDDVREHRTNSAESSVHDEQSATVNTLDDVREHRTNSAESSVHDEQSATGNTLDDVREHRTNSAEVNADTENQLPEGANAVDNKSAIEASDKYPETVQQSNSNLDKKLVGSKSDFIKNEASYMKTAANLSANQVNKTTGKPLYQPRISKDLPSKQPVSKSKNASKIKTVGRDKLAVNSQMRNTTDKSASLQEAGDSVGGGYTASGDGYTSSGSVGMAAVDEMQVTDAHAIVAELDALGLRVKTDDKSKKGLTFPLATGKRPKAPVEKTKIPDHIAEALKRQPMESLNRLEKDLERMTDLVTETLSGPTLEAIGEGLTEEEFELAKALLMKKLDEAKGKLDNKDSSKSGKKKTTTKGKGGKKGKKKSSSLEEKSDEDLEREAIRAKHEEEKKKRDEEAAELQRQIAEKRKLLQGQTDLTSAQSRELQEKMAELERQAEDLMRAEEDARSMLAEQRRKQREEREARRKADLERKRQEAQERREREKRELEERKKREEEMIQKMEDIEMRRRMREEEERRADEEERLAQERYELEMAAAARLEEEEEERIREMERQAEEEAMVRLIEEREEAERQRRRLREEEELLREEEERKKSEFLAEQARLEMERQKILEAENAKRELEKQRLLELRRLEEEARQRMLDEIEARRTNAIARRDYNIENRNNMDKLKYNQELTRAWTFSYFVHWPRETYERPIGDPDPRKVVKIKNPAPKKVVDPAVAEGSKDEKVVPPNPT